jgi:beta-lactam-binding protein with PASTA domain
MKKPFFKTFGGSIVLIFMVCFALYWIFFLSLSWITGHGKEMKVPNLTGKSLKESMLLLNQAGFDIDIDSSYNPNLSPLLVISQQPDAGSTVKIGRTIFLIVNRQSPPSIPMPNLVNLSFRSAEMMLQSNKLLLLDTIMKPDLAQGAVLAQLLNGKDIAAGAMIPQGSKITLVIGDGYGNKQISVPDLVGLSYPEAIAVLNGSNINYTAVFDGVISDTTSAVVYIQLPAALNDFNEKNNLNIETDNIDIRIRQSLDTLSR